MVESARFPASDVVTAGPSPKTSRVLAINLGWLRCAKALALFLLLMMAPSCRGESPGALLKSQFDAAKAALAANDLPGAETHFHETIALGLRQLANLCISEEKYDLAVGYLKEAQKLKPDEFRIQLALAIALFRSGDEKQASDVVNSALASRPSDPQAHNLMGRIFLLEEDFPRAVQELRTAPSRCKMIWRPLTSLASLISRLRNCPKLSSSFAKCNPPRRILPLFTFYSAALTSCPAFRSLLSRSFNVPSR